MISPTLFQTRLLNWFQKCGRKTLPWQHPRTPYRVWVSEIMLQQTQVKTVIPYFEKFMRIFPSIEQLGNAEEDNIFSLWSGLGYYTRARHLHQTAKKIAHTFKGNFPSDLKTLQDLPGIGRSTAGAILALGFNQYAPILDGNVKRILSRIHTVESPVNEAKAIKQLWQLAEQYTPLHNPCDYTQAIMDFGSLICTRHNPTCQECPMSSHCLAYLQNKTNDYPRSKYTRSLPSRETNFLILINQEGSILLEKRPPSGIWGGLWSLPECTSNRYLNSWCQKQYHCTVTSMRSYSPIRHTFSHFHLTITPVICQVSHLANSIQDNPAHSWVRKEQLQQKGLATPVKKLLEHIFNQSNLFPSSLH